MMFKKLVAIEPVDLVPSAEKELFTYADKVTIHTDIPADNTEIIKRIGEADGVLLSYTSKIDKDVLDACPNIRYIGMCCSLYSPESANVDIAAAEEKGIQVYGIRDYGDEGVVEYVLHQLIGFLQGFGEQQWKELPLEITGLNVGIVGLGTSGLMVGKALQFLGAKVSYYSRTRKPKEEEKGINYLPLNTLLQTSDVVCTCLNKNVILLYEEEFQKFGNGKILFNTSIGPSHDIKALSHWLDQGNNYFFCDTEGALGDSRLLTHAGVNCVGRSSGRTKQAYQRLSDKVLENIVIFFK